MTTKEIKRVIVKSILTVPNLTLTEWQDLFKAHPKGHSVAVSTISGWRNGKQEMSFYYRNILIRILCDTQELQQYQQKIRETVLKNMGVKSCQKLYFKLQEKDYETFLKFALNEMSLQSTESGSYEWKDASMTDLLELCVKRAERIQSQPRFDAEICKDDLLFTYYFDNEIENYKVAAGFVLGEISADTLEESCIKFAQRNAGCLIGYIFVTTDVPDELYYKMLEEYRILFLKIDEMERKCAENPKNHIEKEGLCCDTTKLHHMENLVDEILRKMREMNRILTGLWHLPLSLH